MKREDWLDRYIGDLMLVSLELDHDLSVWRKLLVLFPGCHILFSIWLIRAVVRGHVT